MNGCPFCSDSVKQNEIILENDLCLFLQREEAVLIGSGLIIPRAHRETAFDLTNAEWNTTYALLQKVKSHLDRLYHPAGYNLGWNSGAAAGQEVFHAHLHVIPRYLDEPYVGRGIRYWLKQEANRRK
jgi:diadenosine tetraphosphate (Ap4A) HIT family hydrolase